MSDISITVKDRGGQLHVLSGPTDMGLNVMELCKIYELPVEGTCGGMALCASCHVYVQDLNFIEKEMSEDEENMLDQAFFVTPNSRLGCQIRLTSHLDGVVVELAPVGQ